MPEEGYASAWNEAWKEFFGDYFGGKRPLFVSGKRPLFVSDLLRLWGAPKLQSLRPPHSPHTHHALVVSRADLQVSAPCCGEFLVTRKAIQQLPKEFYEKTLEWMDRHGEENAHKIAVVMEVGVLC